MALPSEHMVVLVRISGPDPQERKVIGRPFFHAVNGRTALSASGIVVDALQGIIIASGSLVWPFLRSRDRETPELITDTRIHVLVCIQSLNDTALEWIPARLVSYVQVDVASDAVDHLCHSTGGFERGWGIGSSSSRGSDNSLTGGAGDLALLQVPVGTLPHGERERTICWGRSEAVRKGQAVIVVGSPFGNTSPVVLANSMSKGIISNVVFHKGEPVLFFTDARTLPGTEGGAVFDSCRHLIGVIAPPIRRVDGDPAELGLILASDPLLRAVESNLFQPTIERSVTCQENSTFCDMVEKAEESLCLCQIGSMWASGIIVTHAGHILTNAHLLRPHLETRSSSQIDTVRLRHKITLRVRLHPAHWFPADAVFVSLGPVDVALLRICGTPSLSPMEVPAWPKVRKEKTVFVLGHALFGSKSGLSSTCTSGTLSKIALLRERPALLQTSARVHHGNSGGMLLDEHGQLLGMVTSNARHSGGRIIPSLNFTIPSNLLRPLVDYAQSNDTSILQQYEATDAALEDLWSLRGTVPEPDPPESTAWPRAQRFFRFVDEVREQHQSRL